METARDTRVKASEANAIAIKSENEVKIAIANSDYAKMEAEAKDLFGILAKHKF